MLVTLLLLSFWMFCYCKCSMALPHGALGWSAVLAYSISLSYSLSVLYCKNIINITRK